MASVQIEHENQELDDYVDIENTEEDISKSSVISATIATTTTPTKTNEITPMTAAPTSSVVSPTLNSTPSVKDLPSQSSTEGKKLCNYSQKACSQHPMDGYSYCFKHILEDPSAPFSQCQYLVKATNKQCTNPVSTKEEEPRYCAAHKQMLGLMPRKVPQPKKRLAKKAGKLPELLSPTPSLEEKQKHLQASELKARKRKLNALLSKRGVKHSDAYRAIWSRSTGDGDSSSSSSPEDSDLESNQSSSTDSGNGQDADEEPPVSEEHAVLRRKEKINKLIKEYKQQFKRLRDTLRIKHSKFIKMKHNQIQAKKKEVKLDSSSSGIKENREMKKLKMLEHYHDFKHTKGNIQPEATEKKTTQEDDKKKNLKLCHYEGGCRSESMPLTKYCYAHILSDPKQTLFKSCAYVTASVQCKYPILVGQEPPYCNGHIDLVVGKEGTTPRAPRKRKLQFSEESAGTEGSPENPAAAKKRESKKKKAPASQGPSPVQTQVPSPMQPQVPAQVYPPSLLPVQPLPMRPISLQQLPRAPTQPIHPSKQGQPQAIHPQAPLSTPRPPAPIATHPAIPLQTTSSQALPLPSRQVTPSIQRTFQQIPRGPLPPQSFQPQPQQFPPQQLLQPQVPIQRQVQQGHVAPLSSQIPIPKPPSSPQTAQTQATKPPTPTSVQSPLVQQLVQPQGPVQPVQPLPSHPNVPKE